MPDAGPDASAAIVGRREVWLPEAGGFVACPVYDRERLRAGNRIDGPAIVEQMDATTVIAARHAAARRTIPEPDPGGGMMTSLTRSSSIDPITVEVIGSALASIVEEMGEALVRASYSTNIKERRDCSTALFDTARQHAVPGRAHPDASRQLHRHHPAHPEAPPVETDAAGRRVHRQRRL